MSKITEEDIINTLTDLRGLKAELEGRRKDRVRIDDDIEGLESDIESAENSLREQIKEFTSSDDELIARAW